MAVDDQTAARIDAKFAQHLLAELFLVDEGEIGILLLLVRVLVGDEVALQGGDTILAEEWAARAAPEVPEEVEIFRVAPLGSAEDDLVDRFKHRAPGDRLPVNDQRQKPAKLVAGDAAVEDQVIV